MGWRRRGQGRRDGWGESAGCEVYVCGMLSWNLSTIPGESGVSVGFWTVTHCR